MNVDPPSLPHPVSPPPSSIPVDTRESVNEALAFGDNNVLPAPVLDPDAGPECSQDVTLEETNNLIVEVRTTL